MRGDPMAQHPNRFGQLTANSFDADRTVVTPYLLPADYRDDLAGCFAAVVADRHTHRCAVRHPIASSTPLIR